MLLVIERRSFRTREAYAHQRPRKSCFEDLAPHAMKFASALHAKSEAMNSLIIP
jgi:hypothetical protein